MGEGLLSTDYIYFKIGIVIFVVFAMWEVVMQIYNYVKYRELQWHLWEETVYVWVFTFVFCIVAWPVQLVMVYFAVRK